jgi:hypothetical protein
MPSTVPAAPPTPPPIERDRILADSYGRIPRAPRLPQFEVQQ